MAGVGEALNALWASFVEMLPGIIAAIIWIVIGAIVAVVVGNIVTRVVKKYVEKPISATPFGKTLAALGLEFSSLIGGLTKAFIIAVVLVAAISYIPLGGDAGALIYSVVNYLPYLIGGIALITFGLVLAIALARYIGSILASGLGDTYRNIATLIENMLLVGLIAVVLTAALALLKIPAGFIYPLLLGSLAIVVGVFISVEVFKVVEANFPNFKPLTPFIQFILLLAFSLIGFAAIFSQYPTVGEVLKMISAGIAIAFGITLIPIAFYLARKALAEAGKSQ